MDSIKGENMFRIGHGYDIHQLVDNRKLILGGVEIPYEKGLLGHSDADVLAHAISDALLGALALGDIGKFFPDTDEAFKDADSMMLLKEVCDKIHVKGYAITNIDTTIMAQAPKLRKYIDTMRRNIAEICDINIGQVNVKATTMEQLGPIGEGKGIAVHCVVLLQEKA